MTLFDAIDQAAPTMRKDALISDCGLYRYWLLRQWDASAPFLPIIMLNPSTADASIDDPTIRRCIGFARRDGFGGIKVMNLFAFRATSPADMIAARDPIGPDCYSNLIGMIDYARQYSLPVLAAWGAHGSHLGRDRAVMSSARGIGARLVCLGMTKLGHPRHPLYVAGHQSFMPFEVQS
ncbi:hypothetical protein S2M10_29710 [Sphingomonas sp. S2M10]|uniref:DUF1643 domain-containing protein n=1 Tax=Sphingomonas sp. S2M10 TaxID=2705010 RepID=UPI0016B9AD39|nr:DUF1643 domain-containing protein [Sphingomonas sp. S2M10]NLS27969.1 hypothetical protein [Sphingomonas sp. S2M10]